MVTDPEAVGHVGILQVDDTVTPPPAPVVPAVPVVPPRPAAPVVPAVPVVPPRPAAPVAPAVPVVPPRPVAPGSAGGAGAAARRPSAGSRARRLRRAAAESEQTKRPDHDPDGLHGLTSRPAAAERLTTGCGNGFLKCVLFREILRATSNP